MPRKAKTTAAADKAAQPQFSAECLSNPPPAPVTSAEPESILHPSRIHPHCGFSAWGID